MRLTPLGTCAVNQIVPLYLWGRGPKGLGLGQGSPPPAFLPREEPPRLLRLSGSGQSCPLQQALSGQPDAEGSLLAQVVRVRL